MPARSAWVIAAILLLPAAAAAQDGLRSASLPERPLSPSLVREGHDVFRPAAGTYRPDPDRLFFPYVPVFPYVPLVQWPVVPQFGWPTATQVVYVPVEAGPLRRTRPAYDHVRGDDANRRQPAVEQYQPSAPGKPKTFYVIPGCYAGDRRPEPATLAPGCTLSKLRIINP